jgi:hypothetical protein
MDALLAERHVSLLHSLRSDPSFVKPGADHFKAASGLLYARMAVHTHEANRLRRHQIERARHHVNTRLIPSLRRPMHQYEVPQGSMAQ